MQPFEAICTLGGVSCGFDEPVQVRALGNEDLEVEKIRSFELGYNAAIGKRTYLAFDAFYNQVDNFISFLLVGIGFE